MTLTLCGSRCALTQGPLPVPRAGFWGCPSRVRLDPRIRVEGAAWARLTETCAEGMHAKIGSSVYLRAVWGADPPLALCLGVLPRGCPSLDAEARLTFMVLWQTQLPSLGPVGHSAVTHPPC